MLCRNLEFERIVDRERPLILASPPMGEKVARGSRRWERRASILRRHHFYRAH